MTADYYYDRYRFFDETLITKRVWDTMMQQHGNRPPHNEEDCDAAPDDEEASASGRLSGKRKRDHDGREASGNAGTGYASASRLAVGSSSTDTSGTTMQPAWMLNWQQLGGRVRSASPRRPRKRKRRPTLRLQKPKRRRRRRSKPRQRLGRRRRGRPMRLLMLRRRRRRRQQRRRPMPKCSASRQSLTSSRARRM